MELWIVIFGIVIAVTFTACQATRSSYASVPYKLVRSTGKFEVRDYPALIVAETPLANPNGSNGSFMRLFRFITGANETKQKIPMTTPVFMSGSNTNAMMAFVMPAQMSRAAVPLPNDGSVIIQELSPGCFAVLRYSGGRNAKNEAEALARLKTWMEQEHMSVLSPPVYSYFDPPWTPTFLRRNEVMLRTEQPK